MKCNVQIRRSGFIQKSPWGTSSYFNSIDEAKNFINDIAKMADNYDCTFDYKISDLNGNVIEEN